MKKFPTIDDIRYEYPFKQNYMYAGKHRIHYIDEGEGPALIMLHACPMWSFFYRRFVKVFSRHFRVIVPDEVGYGLSDKPKDYDYRLETHIDNLERLVNHLKLEKVSFILHGWGGTIGTGFTVRHSQMVDKIILMNSMAFSGYKLPLRLSFCKLFPWIGRKLLIDFNLMFYGLNIYSEEIKLGYMFPYMKPDDRIAIVRFINDIPCKPDDLSYESVIEVEHGLWMLREHKMCIIWAVKDWLYPEKYLHKWMNYCPDAKVHRVRNAGRFIAEDAPEELIAIISGFLGVEGQ